MIRNIREFMWRKIPLVAYQGMRYCAWYAVIYLPRSLFLWDKRVQPKIQGFASSNTSGLMDSLGAINVLSPTEMCRVMTWHGSDKGRIWHNYTVIYSVLFGKLRNLPLRIFELGLGTNNPQLVSTMGVDGQPGASLRGWRELFPKAFLYGADIDRDILFEEDRIKTFYCDQLDSVAIRELWSQPELSEGMDIIIDDGLHTFEGNVSFLEGSLEHLRPGGIYVVEDILGATLDDWRDRLQSVYVPRFPGYEFALIELPNDSNSLDNNLLVIRKPVN